ncbi:class I SAM-dependent methyltransferase [Sphingosinithalassobacter sp. LHW66-3]|uniref:class I SAM-dependent methyltransferase n=1 Tax=Sphingosinithalassobacter sp. LHW66-3 TaxID=3424718 RepID=UPI003D6A97A1
MPVDRSEGWDAVADRFMAVRSDVGAATVRSWAREKVRPGGAIVDVGCGSGIPITRALAEDGFELFGIDASPALIAAFGREFPNLQHVCEAAQESGFFGRRFDAAVAIGLIFLLAAEDQARLIARIAHALVPGGRFLFTAPREACEWQDMLTGRTSRSLGQAAYARLCDKAGLRLVGGSVDEGGNSYHDAVRPAA